jgi:carbon storage regulator CsrA
MLVLTRKVGEAVVIQCNGRTLATVKVACIDKDRMRLAIDAPGDVGIWRSEIAPPEVDKKQEAAA